MTTLALDQSPTPIPIPAPTRDRATGSGGPLPVVDGPSGPVRLLDGLGDGPGAEPLTGHLARWGGLPPERGLDVLAAVDGSGLRGRGGAWYPVATKWRAVREAPGPAPVVVVNAAEGEPASAKDRFLLGRRPHLVLDGAALAARVVGAAEVVVYAPRDLHPVVEAAVRERQAAGVDHCPVRRVASPGTFLAGQESAVVNAINGLDPVPSSTALRPVRRIGVDGRPTLVQNAETLALAALVARFGPEWFRSVGSPESPGTLLLTVTGRWPGTRIVEAPLALPLGTTLRVSGEQAAATAGVLLGGYSGGWLPTETALAMPVTEEEARARGASLGPGVVALLPSGVCPLREVARVVRFLQGQGAGQCGPCVYGLAELADRCDDLALDPRRCPGPDTILELCALVEGRGACAHPDGVARFARSALTTFADHVESHGGTGPCPPGDPFLPLPPTSPPSAPSAVATRGHRGWMHR